MGNEGPSNTPELLVLVVEDEAPIQDLVRDALSDGGFQAELARTGEEALGALRERPKSYRALVTDIRLGQGMDGWELARRVREIDPNFPVVYMTGDSGEAWKSRGVPESILLQKPFAPAQLLTAVSQLLNMGTPPV
ncbi:response regulator [Bradyrhizobium diazoefficiens]|uniref:response regulator n=1 Tax=Bradyrhizobium diazoefficiens TaxID=1355477 RepID=UPI00190B6DD6|nr:response regulator [Bradyrhizobium diazoefficiens]QQO12554.1 response regulator [Bradyrhizobium diazoefficiens]